LSIGIFPSTPNRTPLLFRNELGVKRLLFIGNEARYFLTHRLPVGKAALQAGYDVHVAAPGSELRTAIEAHGFHYHPVAMTRFGKNPFVEARTALGLWRLYRRLNPDIVHHVTAKPVLYGSIAARLANVRATVYAVTGLGHLFLGQELTYRFLRVFLGAVYRIGFGMKRARVIFQNEEDRDLFVDNGWVSLEKTVLIRGSGVDPEVFTPAHRVADSDVTVMFPSRMLYTKGLREFIEMARTLTNEKLNARFVLVGDPEPGNPASISEAQIELWVREGIVEYWGRRDDMPLVLAQADIVCLPSYREGTPKVLIEAAATGAALVTTDTPGCRNVVVEGGNGYLVPVGDRVELGDRVRELVLDAELRARMGQRGRELVLNHFTTDHVVAATLKVYEDLSL
jgi:glycosyltransferase involved in cell wall biosynthesis